MKRLLAFGAVVLFAFLAGHRAVVSGDDGTYLALARSLHEGAYRAINAPGAPVQVQYPPLFPLLLYPVAALPSSAFGAARLWMAAWAILAVVAVAAAAVRRDRALGVVAALPFVASPLFGLYGTSVLSEIVFILLAYAVLARLPRTPPGADGRTGLDPFLPLGLAAAWLTKSLGVALFAAVVVSLFARGRRREAWISALVVAAVMVPWWGWQAYHASDYVRGHILQRDIYDPSAGTLGLPQLLFERVPFNVSRYVGRILAETLLPPFAGALGHRGPELALKIALGLLLAVSVAAGFVRRWRDERWGAEELFVVFTSGLLAVHPVYADRYLFLIAPSLIGYLLLAVRDRGLGARLAFAWSGVLVLGCVLALTAPVPREELAYYEAVDWLKEHTPRSAVVLARKPTPVWYYADRVATGYPPSVDTRAWRHADYVIRDDYTIGIHAARRYADPVLSDPALFTLAWTSAILPSVRIYARTDSR